MQLLTVLDPRDTLEKVRKDDLLAYAKANNMTGITEQMPATLIRLHFRQTGIVKIDAPVQGYAQEAPQAPIVKQEQEPETPALTQEDVDKANFASGAYNAPPDYHTMKLPELRKLVKAKGLKQSRGEGGESLIAKLEALDGQDAA